jgi:hypothetical protein
MNTTTSPALWMMSVILAAFTCLLPDAEGIVRRDDVPDQDYIDLGASFPAVGLFSSDGTTRGSGVLISETGTGSSEWVLTAAHITTPNQFFIDGTVYEVAEVIRHPDWGGESGGPPGSGIADDIALVRLSMPVSGVTPMQWHSEDNDLQPGVEVFTVGFGLSGTGLTGESGSAGTRRAAENTIEARGSTSPLTPIATAFEYHFHAPEESAARAMEGMGVLYDSGGPVVVDFGLGNVVVGIHSYVMDNDGQGRGTYGDVLGATRVPLYSQWIQETIPEPHTAVLFGGALILLAALRHRIA